MNFLWTFHQTSIGFNHHKAKSGKGIVFPHTLFPSDSKTHGKTAEDKRRKSPADTGEDDRNRGETRVNRWAFTWRSNAFPFTIRTLRGSNLKFLALDSSHVANTVFVTVRLTVIPLRNIRGVKSCLLPQGLKWSRKRPMGRVLATNR